MFYSFGPKFATQAPQSVGKTGRTFIRIPRGNHEGAFVAFLQQVPQPHHRVEPQAQAGRSFGALAFVRLGLLAPHKLFGIFERVFDGPAVGVIPNHGGRVHCHIGAEKKIVFLFAFRIATDHQQDGLVQNAIPQDNLGVNQSGAHLAAFADFDTPPVLHPWRHFFWRRQPLAFGTGATRAFFLAFGFGRQVVNLGVALDSRDDRGPGQLLSRQGGVKPISHHLKPPFGKPLQHVVDHLLSQFDQAGLVFAMQPHVDRQPQRFATPGRLNLQGQHDQVQPSGRNMFVLARTHRIAPPSGSVDLFAAVMKQGIVQGQSNRAGSTERSDQEAHQLLPQFVHTPAGIRKKPMIRIVSLRTGRVGKGQHAGHRSSDGAENPAHRQSHKDDAAGLSENPKKGIEKRRPCRYRSGHTNLRVVYGFVFPLQPSVGWYFFVRKSSILAA